MVNKDSMPALDAGTAGRGSLPAAPEKANILIVDDLPEKLLVFQSILEELDQNLIMVNSGREALRQVLERDFAVILLDVNMPDIDGFETATLIRQYRRTAKTPIVFITAYVDEIQTVRGYALGAVDYIVTPVVPEILRSKINVFVDLFQMHRQLQRQAEEREALARAEAARAAAEQAKSRADLLAQASDILTRSLDIETTVQGMLRFMVPQLTEVALLTMVDKRGAITRTELAWQPAGGRRDENYRHSTESQLSPLLVELIGTACRSGQAQQLRRDEVAPIEAVVESSRFELQLTAAVILPLFAAGEPLGALTFAAATADGQALPDLAFASEFAGRVAIALENGLLYRTIRDGDRRKNEFLAMLAHELRNPLAPIRNAVHVLQANQQVDGELQWAADIIGRQVDHMARLMDDLLDISRIARGKVSIQQDNVPLAAVIERSIETSRPLIDVMQHRLMVELPTQPIALRGDMVRLAQIFSNLLNNAAKYSPQGSDIWLRADFGGGVIHVSVRDNGTGIAPEFMPHVFELFAQGDNSIDRAHGGLGVGLTLVKYMVELHEGHIDVASTGLGGGAEFIVKLPARELAVVIESPAPRVASGSGCRVLVVDDLESSAETMGRLLQLKGYTVDIAHDGPTALETAERTLPDVVLLDIGLPGMNGFEVAQRLRRRSDMQSTLLIALTGYGQEEDRLRAEAAGFDMHMVKPADIARLLDAIEQHCIALAATPRVVNAS